jgi:hypothetical protein
MVTRMNTKGKKEKEEGCRPKEEEGRERKTPT